jgi:hypothetical protein
MKPKVYWLSLMLACLLGQKPSEKRRRRDARQSGTWRVRVH